MLRPTLLAGLFALAPSCNVVVDEHELLLRYDAAADRLEFALVHRGIMAREPGKVRAALKDLQPRLDGHRAFGIGWPFEVDLDDLGGGLSREDEALLDQLRLLDRAVFEDERGRFSGFQHARLDGVAAAMVRLNELVDAWVLEDLLVEPGEAETPTGDEAYPHTRARLVEAARAGWDWIAFREGALVVRVPLDPREVGTLVLDLAPSLGEESLAGKQARELWRTVTEIRVDDGLLEATIAPDEDGILAWTLETNRAGEWDPALYELVLGSDRAHLFREEVTRASVRALLLRQ